MNVSSRSQDTQLLSVFQAHLSEGEMKLDYNENLLFCYFIFMANPRSKSKNRFRD